MHTAHLVARVVIALSVLWFVAVVVGSCLAAGRADDQEFGRDNRSLRDRMQSGAARDRAMELTNKR